MSNIDQISLPKLIINHFYVGVIITLFYIWLGPTIISAGYPGLSLLLIAEVAILLPLVTLHLLISSQQRNHDLSLKGIISFRQKLSPKSFLIWLIGGILVSLLIYIPLYPVGLYLRESVFSWLPEWYFNYSYGISDTRLLASIFLIAIPIDGILGPVVEELFFRGYLLPRMSYLKGWAPILNGTLFGLYHFWQPHNLIALIAVGIVFSYVVWKTKNVYLGIAIHCTLNILGAVGGYLASSEGIIIGR